MKMATFLFAGENSCILIAYTYLLNDAAAAAADDDDVFEYQLFFIAYSH